MSETYIYDHVRTPRGKGRPDGALHEIPALELASQVLQALRRRTDFPVERLGEVGLGIVMPVGEQGADLTRAALLHAGYGDAVGGYQLNRFCTSGLDTVRMAHALISSGQAQAAIGGGVESMSRVAIGSDGGAFYTDVRLGTRFPYMPNGVAADLLATLDGWTREDVDSYALQSQQRAAHAQAAGHFDKSLVAVRDSLGQTVLERDEAIRPGSSLEGLAKLRPVFGPMAEQGFGFIAKDRYPDVEAIRHIHTSGNSSGIVDGACAVLLGNAGFGRESGIPPRARVLGSVSCASEPLLSLDGPLPATQRLLRSLGMSAADIDLFEVNEAFAVVPLRYMRHFGLDADRVNVNGGAIALGHPLGATGAMLVGTLLDELERRGDGVGLVTLCAAAGQSTALVIERV
ncbi:acetyl-CoA C-acetyltransferase [Alcaligenaceae bacterium]|nr:acetyl-CoA C-acetyltransferase [Alcaligenaceae bacterium]